MDLSGDADETLLPDPESPPTSVAPWTEVEVSFERAGSETVGGEKASVDQEDGWTNVHRLPDPDLVDSNPPEDRADFLTRQATEALLGAGVQWPSAQESLKRLVRTTGS